MSKKSSALARFIENLPVEAIIEETQVTTLSLMAGEEYGDLNKGCNPSCNYVPGCSTQPTNICNNTNCIC